MSKKFLHLSSLATVLHACRQAVVEARYSGEFPMRCDARRNRNPAYRSKARAEYIKKEAPGKMARRFKYSRKHKPSRRQDSDLPGSPEEDVVEGIVAQVVVNVHTTSKNMQYGVETARECFDTTAEVPFQEIFPGDDEMHRQRDHTDGSGQCRPPRVLPSEETGLFVSCLRVPHQPVGFRHRNEHPIVSRGSLPGVSFAGKVADDLAGRNELSQRPAAVPHDFAVGSFGYFFGAVAGKTQHTADDRGGVDERRTADRPCRYEPLHLC